MTQSGWKPDRIKQPAAKGQSDVHPMSAKELYPMPQRSKHHTKKRLLTTVLKDRFLRWSSLRVHQIWVNRSNWEKPRTINGESQSFMISQNGGFHKWGYPKWLVYKGKSHYIDGQTLRTSFGKNIFKFTRVEMF